MAVRTSITPSDLLAALKKWGVPYRLYRSDWATHNRNHKGDWGPINGVEVHNFASNIADTSSNRYLSAGDNARGMPGPLSQLSLDDEGTTWVIGWGRANHAGMGEKRVLDLVMSDKMPRDRELVPSTSGSVDFNARFIGIEMLYGGTRATQAQRDGIVLLCAALVDMLGAGYTGGSVIGHGETTNQRSDPEGFDMGALRRQVDARLAAGPPGSTKPSAPKPTPQPEDDDMPYSPDQLAAITKRADVTDAIADDVWQPARLNVVKSTIADEVWRSGRLAQVSAQIAKATSAGFGEVIKALAAGQQLTVEQITKAAHAGAAAALDEKISDAEVNLNVTPPA